VRSLTQKPQYHKIKTKKKKKTVGLMWGDNMDCGMLVINESFKSVGKFNKYLLTAAVSGSLKGEKVIDQSPRFVFQVGKEREAVANHIRAKKSKGIASTYTLNVAIRC
jgi:hypothetical protein